MLLSNGAPIHEFVRPIVTPRTIGVRIHGLIGDCIKASTIMSAVKRENPGVSFVVLGTNTDPGHKDVLPDIFSGLIARGDIAGLFFSPYDNMTNFDAIYSEFFHDLGIYTIIEHEYLHRPHPTCPPDLGIVHLPRREKHAALFRFSGFHSHVPRRHIPPGQWMDIENFLREHGWVADLYGYDDMMPTTIPPERDHRRKLSVLETLRTATDASLVVSTTTFFPLYLHHSIPCVVFADPADVRFLENRWRSNDRYCILSTDMPYMDTVKRAIDPSWVPDPSAVQGLRDPMAVWA